MPSDRLETSVAWFRLLVGLLLFTIGFVQIFNWVAAPASTWFADIPYVPQPLLAFACVLLATPISLVGSGLINSEDHRQQSVKRFCQFFAVLCALSLYRFIAAAVDLYVEGQLPQHRKSFGIWLGISFVLCLLYGYCVLKDVEEEDKPISITSDGLKTGSYIWYFHATVVIYYWNTPSAAKLVQDMSNVIRRAGYGAAAGTLNRLSAADVPNFIRFYEMHSQIQNIVQPEVDSQKLTTFLDMIEDKKSAICGEVTNALEAACLAEAGKRFGPRKVRLRRKNADTAEAKGSLARLMQTLRLPAGRPCEVEVFLSIEYSDKLQAIMDVAQKIKTDAQITRGAEGAKVRAEILLRYAKGYTNAQDAIHMEQSLNELVDTTDGRDGDSVPPLLGAQGRRDITVELKAEGESQPKSISSGTGARNNLTRLTQVELDRKLITAVGRDRSLQDAQLRTDIRAFFAAAGDELGADLFAAFLITWGQAAGYDKLNEQVIVGGCKEVPRFVEWVRRRGVEDVRQELINEYIQQMR